MWSANANNLDYGAVVNVFVLELPVANSFLYRILESAMCHWAW